jgi:hypothetical protein
MVKLHHREMKSSSTIFVNAYLIIQDPVFSMAPGNKVPSFVDDHQSVCIEEIRLQSIQSSEHQDDSKKLKERWSSYFNELLSESNYNMTAGNDD